MTTSTQTKTNLFLANHDGHDVRELPQSFWVLGERVEGEGSYPYCRTCETVVAR